MDNFDDIRPYRDDELEERIAALIRNHEVIGWASQLKFPNWYRTTPVLVRTLIRLMLRAKSRRLTSLSELHKVLAGYVNHIVQMTADGFSFSGD